MRQSIADQTTERIDPPLILGIYLVPAADQRRPLRAKLRGCDPWGSNENFGHGR